MAEKIRKVLVAKRELIIKNQKGAQTIGMSSDTESALEEPSTTGEASDPDWQMLREWVNQQNSYRLPVDSLSDDFKIKMAKTLIRRFGDKILT